MAPDQRGSNESVKPPRVRGYMLDKLAGNVAGLIAVAGRQRAVIAGLDSIRAAFSRS